MKINRMEKHLGVDYSLDINSINSQPYVYNLCIRDTVLESYV